MRYNYLIYQISIFKSSSEGIFIDFRKREGGWREAERERKRDRETERQRLVDYRNGLV